MLMIANICLIFLKLDVCVKFVINGIMGNSIDDCEKQKTNAKNFHEYMQQNSLIFVKANIHTYI